ncbi:hypothetical protein QYE76_015535 [Lolium multiflorum]|uniref:Myb/SANT-like domain-containing protein n=1 Tax=Lolium multiflorum TaxID=4521 RepID=A0AAD8X6H5_LOLMU|nr:hypothetical protein QYE76_015535 [Lolium multiflorum]
MLNQIASKPAMVWKPELSEFVLNRLVQLVRSGVCFNMGFKEEQTKKVAVDVLAFAGVHGTTLQLYNHIKNWRMKWSIITKMKSNRILDWSEAGCCFYDGDEGAADEYILAKQQEHGSGEERQGQTNGVAKPAFLGCHGRSLRPCAACCRRRSALPPSAPTDTAATLRLLCLWHLWKHRNGVVFERLPPSLSMLHKRCRDDATLWRARLSLEQRSDVDLWLTYFLPEQP